MFVSSKAVVLLVVQLAFGLRVSHASPGSVLAQSEADGLFSRSLQSDNSSRCSAFPVCRGLNLTGDCCPTINGTLLNCCNETSAGNETTPAPTRRPRRQPTSEAPSEEPSPAPAADGPTRRPRRPPTSPPTRRPAASPSSPVADSRQCSAFPICAADALTGNCCPTDNGVELYCCNEVETNCEANPACVLANLTGACCPTDTGEFLDCCDREPGTCAAHQACSHLIGDCCPTEAGTFLDCCNNSTKPDTNGTTPGTNGTTPGTNSTTPGTNGTTPGTNGTTPGTNGTVQAACSSHPKCANLTGACCPTEDNVFLFCCDKYRDTCASNSKCADLGLVGKCCPAANGTYLACCERDFAACRAHPACQEEGRRGNCCPNDNGTFAECCLNDTSVKSLEFQSAVSQTTSGAPAARGKSAIAALFVAALVALL